MLPYILTGVICFVVAAVLFFVVGVQYRKKVAEKEISSAEEEAKRIINESIKSAESKKREDVYKRQMYPCPPWPR